MIHVEKASGGGEGHMTIEKAVDESTYEIETARIVFSAYESGYMRALEDVMAAIRRHDSEKVVRFVSPNEEGGVSWVKQRVRGLIGDAS